MCMTVFVLENYIIYSLIHKAAAIEESTPCGPGIKDGLPRLTNTLFVKKQVVKTVKRERWGHKAIHIWSFE